MGLELLFQGSNIDLRSSTPVEVDIDGNGIVESQENLAPDQKQRCGTCSTTPRRE